MNADLEAIKDAWDKETGDGREEDKTRELADSYVDANSEQFEALRDLTLEDCVKAVDVFRAAGMKDEQWRVEAWLLHAYEPQTIGGTYQAKVRLTNGR